MKLGLIDMEIKSRNSVEWRKHIRIPGTYEDILALLRDFEAAEVRIKAYEFRWAKMRKRIGELQVLISGKV